MRFLVALGLLLLWAAALARPAMAQTNFTGGCPSGPSIMHVSPDGLTVSAIGTGSSTGGNCEANNPKYSGKWYYQATFAAVGWTGGVGVASTGWPTSSSFTLPGGDFSSAGYEINSAGGPVNLVSYGQNHFRTAGPLAYTPGKTIAVVIDRDANPSEIWIAPDITDTSGCGGGPVWNGDTTTYAAPVRFTSGAHSPCGGPGTGSGLYGPPDTGQTGMAFFTPFGSAPAMIGQNYNAPATNVTFNFDASATLDAIIGSGGPGPIYRPWNTSGGAPSVPGPLNPMIQNVANAPAWQQNTAYTSFPNDDRVLAGPAYNPGTGLFTNGQPLYLWAVASGGGGTSGNNSTYAGHFGTAPCPVTRQCRRHGSTRRSN